MLDEQFKKAQKLSEEFKKILSTHHGVANISDQLDGLGITNCIMSDVTNFTIPDAKVVGPAVTARGVVHRGTATKSHGFPYLMEARDAAKKYGPGCVMVSSMYEIEALALGSCAAMGLVQAKMAASITDGGVRDVDGIKELNYPVWARCLTPKSAGKGRVEYVGAMDVVQCNGVQIRPADIIIADTSGVAVIPLDFAEQILEKTKASVQREEFLIHEMKNGTEYQLALKKLRDMGEISDWFKKS